MRRIFLIVLVLVVCGVTGCSGPLVQRVKEQDKSIVIGYIDMEEAPSKMQWLDLHQALPKTDKPYWSCAVKDGMFYHIIPQGSYQVTSFGGAARFFLSNTEYNYNMPEYGKNETAVRVTKNGAVYFLGSYKFKHIKGKGFFSPDKFDIVRLKKPTERELLEILLPDAVGTQWEKVIRKRLKELH